MKNETWLYALANLINRSAGLLLIPIYTRLLSASDFGRYALVISMMEVLSMISAAGLLQAMTRLYFDYPEHDPRRNQVVSTTLIMTLAMVFCFSLLSPWLASPFAMLLMGSSEYSSEILVALPGVPCSVLLDLVIGYYVVLKRPWIVLFAALAKAISLIGLNVIFVFGLKLGVWGVFAAQSVAFAIIAIGGTLLVLRTLRTGFHWKIAKNLLRFGLPLVPSAAADASAGVAQRWIVNHLLGAAPLGAWALAQRLSYTIQAFLATPFAQAFFVRRLEVYESGKPQTLLNQVLAGFILVLGLAVFSLSLFAPEVITLIAPNNFDEAARILPLTALGVALTIINFHVEVGLMLTKRTIVVPAISIFSLLLSLPAIWLGIRWLGLAGAPLAQIAVLLVRLGVTWWANRKVGYPPLGEGWMAGFILFLILSVLGGLASPLGFGAPHPELAWPTFLAKLICLAALCGILYQFSPLPKVFLAIIRGKSVAPESQKEPN